MISYAQNGEDVVLARALGGVKRGCYVDIGANDPVVDSVTKVFYDAGWRGVHVEPVPAWADRLRAQRPDEVVVQAAVTRDGVGPVTIYDIEGTGLSTLLVDHDQNSQYTQTPIEVPAVTLREVVQEHVAAEEVQFLKVDVEGLEADVLASADFGTFRPWVCVIEATAPNSSRQVHDTWEPDLLAAGYRFCLFDGLSRFYVSQEKADDLAEALSYPACALDQYETQRMVGLRKEGESAAARAQEAQAEVHDLRVQLQHWRDQVFEHWAAASAGTSGASDAEVAALRRSVHGFESTVSWRVTKPLRAVRSRMPR